MIKFKLLKDREPHKSGTICYECLQYDYGLANDDTDITGIPHVSVTLNSDGDTPFFTVPCCNLQRVFE